MNLTPEPPRDCPSCPRLVAYRAENAAAHPDWQIVMLGPVAKIADADDGSPSVADLITDGKIDLIFNTPSGGQQARGDGYQIRAAATSVGVPTMTTVSELGAALQAITAQRQYSWSVTSLQEHEQKLREQVAAGDTRG